jgi:1-acyl-sn-glycerol-3-phosphate acyltransferase
MAGVRDELKEMARGFRWGRRPLVPRTAEPHALEPKDDLFPTDWARTEAGSTARQVILRGGLGPLLRSQVSLHVAGLDNLADVRGPVLLYSNHTSHLDATIIMCTLPERWRRRTAVGAARDYFFDVWWRKTFTALVYAGFPIDRSRGGRSATDKARELVREGWSIVVFPEGSRSVDGHMHRFRHGASRLALELDIPVVPIAIIGAYQAMPKGKLWPRAGHPPVVVRYGPAIEPVEGETHQELSRRMQQAVAQLFDEERTSWWDSLRRAEAGLTPSLGPPAGPPWRRRWEGSRPVARGGPEQTWK